MIRFRNRARRRGWGGAAGPASRARARGGCARSRGTAGLHRVVGRDCARATRLALKQRPRTIARLQAASALGQARLQQAWEEALGQEGIPAAQILLAAGDVADRKVLRECTTGVRRALPPGRSAGRERERRDGHRRDHVRRQRRARGPGRCPRPRTTAYPSDRGGRRVLASAGHSGRRTSAEGELAGEAEIGAATALGRGGMGSKVVAAQMASGAGIPTVIAAGQGRRKLSRRSSPANRGHSLRPGRAGRVCIQLWLRFGKPVEGSAACRQEKGARRALVEQGGSLLGVGVVSCEGKFDAGAAVGSWVADGAAFGKGIAGAGADELSARQRGLGSRAPRPLGALPVRVAVIADVHGNAPALAAVLAEIEREQPDLIVSCGDFTPGPLPEETFELVRGLNVRFVRGKCGSRDPRAPVRRSTASSGCRRTTRPSCASSCRRSRSTSRSKSTEIRPRSASATARPGAMRMNVTPETPEERVREFSAGIDERGDRHGSRPSSSTGRSRASAASVGSVGLPLRGEAGAYWAL